MSWFTRRDKRGKEIKTVASDIPAGGPEAAAKRRGMLRDMIVFAMFGAMMFCSKIVMEALPNIHLIGMFTVLLTVVYRRRALIPIYIFVMLSGLFYGFSPWWLPYLYIWTILWGVAMLLPKRMPDVAAAFVYPIICGLHGLAYGTLYAPSQALLYGMSFTQMIAWIAAGFPFDLIHAAGNLAVGFLILPLSKLVRRLIGYAAS
jgi:energy-coupling factor transport system substrate-specific component